MDHKWKDFNIDSVLRALGIHEQAEQGNSGPYKTDLQFVMEQVRQYGE